MDWTTELRNIIDKQFHYHGEKGNCIILEELNDKAKGKEVVLYKTSTKTFTLQLDKQKIIKEIKGQDNAVSDVHLMLNDIEGLKKKCDYVVFCQNSKTLFVLLIEMKSNKPPKDWYRQTYAGEAVVTYILKMLESLLDKQLLVNTKFRHILFSTKKPNSPKGGIKKKSKESKSTYKHKLPHNLLFQERSCNDKYEIETFLK